MSLTKLLMAPIKLFRKDVITFVIVRRHDLGIINENLQYIAVKPFASIFVLRQKVWHLLDLPDYCEEVIILKSPGEVEIPLTELRRGNEPRHPYFLEVWSPRHRDANVLTIMSFKHSDPDSTESSFEEKKESLDKICNVSQTTFSHEALLVVNRTRDSNDDLKKPNLTCKFSKSSLFKLNSKKSQDNFTHLLLKIQNDLSTLSSKLSVLEDKLIT